MSAKLYWAGEWLEQNESSLKPPTCSKCMFDGQLQVYFVGGPNNRDDYHIQESEKVFYQVQGKSLVKVFEKGQPKEFTMNQGDTLVLPAKVEHCVHHEAGTIGCVVEKKRTANQLDGIRYFEPGTHNVAWERWYHYTGLDKEIPKLIEEHNSGNSTAKVRDAPYQPDSSVTIQPPINTPKFIDEHLAKINKEPLQFYGPPQFKSSLKLYGVGTYNTTSCDTNDVLIISQRGEITYHCGETGKKHLLKPFHMIHLNPTNNCKLEVADGGVSLTIKLPQ